jgi:hypothetical protein
MNTQETLEEAAEKWVFETNGHKWSNNDDSSGDNYGSFKEGANWQAQRMYTEADIQKAFFAGIAVTGEGWNGEYANGNAPEIEKEFLSQFKEWFKTLNTTKP